MTDSHDADPLTERVAVETITDPERWSHELFKRLTRPDENHDYTVVAALHELRDWLGHRRDSPWATNRGSLSHDLGITIEALGPDLRATIEVALGSAKPRLEAVLDEAEPTRPARHRATDAADELLAALRTSAASLSAWRDVVTAAQDDTTSEQTMRTRTATLRAILLHRGAGQQVVRALGMILENVKYDIVAAKVELGFEPPPKRWPDVNEPAGEAVSQRLELCEALVAQPTRTARCVAWTALWGWMSRSSLSVGPVTYYDAQWVFETAVGSRADFPYRREIEKVEDPLTTYEREVDKARAILARVDLGTRPIEGALELAQTWASTIVDIAALTSGQPWVEYGWQTLFADGEPATSYSYTTKAEIAARADRMAARRTEADLAKTAQDLGVAIARDDLPTEINQAVRSAHLAQTADPATQVIHHDRIVEMVSAYAGMTKSTLETALTDRWPLARWRADVQHAINLAIAHERYSTQPDLARALADRVITDRSDNGRYTTSLVAAAESADELIALLTASPDHRYARVIRCLVDPSWYQSELAQLQAVAKTLGLRRRRVRNAIMHGNPLDERATTSVVPLTSFTSGTAVQLAIDAYRTGQSIAHMLQALEADRAETHARIAAGTSWLKIWTS